METITKPVTQTDDYAGCRNLTSARKAAEVLAAHCRYVCVIRQRDDAFGIKWYAVASRLITYSVRPENWGGEVFRDTPKSAPVWS